MRGIPRQAVDKNLPIKGTEYHAADIADKDNPCRWNPDMWGVDTTKPGAQAYYDSIAKLYASWEVDLIKVDCISSHPYKGDEIRLLSTALANAGSLGGRRMDGERLPREGCVALMVAGVGVVVVEPWPVRGRARRGARRIGVDVARAGQAEHHLAR